MLRLSGWHQCVEPGLASVIKQMVYLQGTRTHHDDGYKLLGSHALELTSKSAVSQQCYNTSSVASARLS